MGKRGSKLNLLKSYLLLLSGMSIGIISIWPGIVTNEARRCFLKIITDGSDGNVTLSTIFSITPNYLLKIKDAQNKYFKVLLVGDFCFRRF